MDARHAALADEGRRALDAQFPATKVVNGVTLYRLDRDGQTLYVSVPENE